MIVGVIFARLFDVIFTLLFDAIFALFFDVIFVFDVIFALLFNAIIKYVDTCPKCTRKHSDSVPSYKIERTRSYDSFYTFPMTDLLFQFF